MSDPELYTQFDAVFFEKTRLSIMTLLYKERVVDFNRLKQLMGATDGGLYSHAQKLLGAGYITQRREIAHTKARTLYSLTPAGEGLYRKYLDFLEGVLRREKGTT